MCNFASGLLIIATIVACSSAQGQDPVAADTEAPLINRFYDITLLVEPRLQYPFQGRQGGTAPGFGGGGMGGMGGGAMGSGGMGGGGGGGGGFFNLTAEPAQFGGAAASGGFGGGAGGANGVGLGGGPAASNQSAERSLKEELEYAGGDYSITGLIEGFISPETWSSNGDGGPGIINDLGHTLLIRQTEKVHKEIETFLKELTIAVIGKGTFQLEAWWIPTTATDRLQLRDTLSGGDDDSEKSAQLSALCESLRGYHGTLLCRERMTAHCASGKQIPIIAGSIPVVGASSTGDQPIVETLHFGLMLEARLSSVPKYLAAADGGTAAEPLEVTFRTSITSWDSSVQPLPPDGKIDRYSMGRHEAAGSCRLQLGAPTLIASLSELSTTKEDNSTKDTEMLMVFRVTRFEN